MKKKIFLSLFIVFNLGFSDLQSRIKAHYNNMYLYPIGNYEQKMLNLKNETEEKFKIAEIQKFSKKQIDVLAIELSIEWEMEKNKIYRLLYSELSDSCRLQLEREEKIWDYKFEYGELDDTIELPISSGNKSFLKPFRVIKVYEARSIELASKYDYLMQLDKQQRKNVCP